MTASDWGITLEYGETLIHVRLRVFAGGNPDEEVCMSISPDDPANTIMLLLWPHRLELLGHRMMGRRPWPTSWTTVLAGPGEYKNAYSLRWERGWQITKRWEGGIVPWMPIEEFAVKFWPTQGEGSDE